MRNFKGKNETLVIFFNIFAFSMAKLYLCYVFIFIYLGVERRVLIMTNLLGRHGLEFFVFVFLSDK